MNTIEFEVVLKPLDALGLIKERVSMAIDFERIAHTVDGKQAVTLVMTKPHFRESNIHTVTVTIDNLQGKTVINTVGSSSLHGMTGIDINSPEHLAMDVKNVFSKVIIENTLHEKL